MRTKLRTDQHVAGDLSPYLVLARLHSSTIDQYRAPVCASVRRKFVRSSLLVWHLSLLRPYAT